MATWETPPITIHHRMQYLPLAIDEVWSLKEYGIPQAWIRSRGAGVKVGAVDTGVDGRHMQDGLLVDAVAGVRDFTRSLYGASDRLGHGTHVLGTIGARQRCGVAPAATLFMAKSLGDRGEGSDQSVGDGIRWLVDQGCQVICLSLGATSESQLILRAVNEAVERGTILVCAAGNDGGRPNFPARWKNTVAVSAVDRQRRIARFSCRGPEIDVAAPGEHITSIYLDGGFAELSGTSMAAPFIAGVLALKISHDQQQGRPPLAAIEEARAWLKRISVDEGEPGPDPLFGVGLPSLADALAEEREAIPAPSSPLFSLGPLRVFSPSRAGDLLSVDVG